MEGVQGTEASCLSGWGHNDTGNKKVLGEKKMSLVLDVLPERYLVQCVWQVPGNKSVSYKEVRL